MGSSKQKGSGELLMLLAAHSDGARHRVVRGRPAFRVLEEDHRFHPIGQTEADCQRPDVAGLSRDRPPTFVADWHFATIWCQRTTAGVDRRQVVTIILAKPVAQRH